MSGLSYAQRAEQWAYAFGEPVATARIRSVPEDFRVEEELGFAPEGQGEHVFLHIRKRGLNTDGLARQIARLAEVKSRDVSYAGLKDRNAVTSQWFSVYLPKGAEPDWRSLESDTVELLEVTRHSRKLRRGALAGNRFVLTLRDLQGETTQVEQRLQAIAGRGVPNYFGPQRFGREYGNLARASALFEGARVKDRHKRGLYLSAARSFLFNEVLAARVAAGNWDQIRQGECLLLEGSRSYFRSETADETLLERLRSGDIHPTGPLWGKGTLASRGEVATLEQEVAEHYPLFADGLARAGLEQERRALRLPVHDLHWRWLQEIERCLEIGFFLPAGAYATSVLREVGRMVES